MSTLYCQLIFLHFPVKGPILDTGESKKVKGLEDLVLAALNNKNFKVIWHNLHSVVLIRTHTATNLFSWAPKLTCSIVPFLRSGSRQ
ncbi:hypothetical protein EYC84_000914 [Monilinia fructicola]|uniref:Uncharacterized protein n=1 Tax=Monilinia fructicola TaxID=38448 RepID=A0A5M9JKR5_MONFR|nr:hypothetical protein EYC84_000914 [Monilinia fructicola]